ncbi:MAG: sigma-70 family RNA polymerase sigma factor [Bacteroidales bacterium]|jgi:RNA polymerase sigma-70 factor (ECF subfamily)|nr:sigma-70 family RNA polymerase sigma factor [Bacteroidales bacterium]
MDDKDAIALILKGDREKFRLLVEKYQQMVFRTCLGFVHNKEDADDLTQDVFIRAYQSLSRFKGNSAFSTWLYRIAVNASLNRIRKSPLNILFRKPGDTSANIKEEDNFYHLKDEDNPEKILIRQEHVKMVHRALESLPENQRTAMVLSKYDELPQKEIAEIMKISEGAVEALLQRAKKNLREKLGASQKKI